MKNNMYDFVLKLFVGRDYNRESLLNPGLIHGNVYATDGVSCIRFDEALTKNDYSSNKSFPDAKSIFDRLELCKSKKVDTEKLLLKVFDCEVKFDNDVEQCDSCHGAGEAECSCCGNDAACVECDGKGSFEKETPYAGISVFGNDIELLGKIVAPKQIYRVLQVAMLFKQSNIEIKYQKNKNELLFYVGNCEIIVMSKHK